jgi:ADP-ribosylglycohydrolase
MDRTVLLDRIQGTLLGCAIGDAMGWPVEFHSTLKGGSRLITDLPKIPRYTDDTQMTICVARGLMRAAQSNSPDSTAEEIAEWFKKWLRDPETPERAPGRACIHGARELDKGVAWREAGLLNGKGCGAAMRSAPYGLWWFDEPWKAADWAGDHALMTHRDASAQASAAAFAAGVSSCIRNENNSQMSQRMALAAIKYDEATATMVSRAYDRAAANEPLESVLAEWEGWKGDEAVSASLYCFLRTPDDFAEAVISAVNSPGDSDSLGAITGALSGARLGLSNIPPSWVERVEGSEMLLQLGVEFFDSMERARRFADEVRVR